MILKTNLLHSIVKFLTPYLIMCCLLWAVCVAAITSFDKHMYPGVDVIGTDQDGQVLIVKLDNYLKLGTDSICLEVTHILQQVALQSGYSVKVIPDSDEWVPFNGQAKSYLELTNIIESGSLY